jgi:hypothetical protein
MRFTILITAAISVLAFVSQSASALPVQDSHGEPSQLSKRQPGDLAPSSSQNSELGLVVIPVGTPRRGGILGMLPVGDEDDTK